MKTTIHPGTLGATALAMFVLASAAFAETVQSPITAEQKAAFFKQAVRLERDLLRDLAMAESDSRLKNVPSVDIIAANEVALQDTITKSGADPRAVLAALSAAQSCPPTGIGYTSDAVSLACDAVNSKPLSKESATALAALQRIIIALIANDPAAGAIGSKGTAPLSAPPASIGGGGSSDYRI